METMKEAPWSRIQGQQRVQRILGDCWQWESNGQCSRGDSFSFRHDINKRWKMTQPDPSPSSSTRQNERNASRTRGPRGKSPSGRTCTNSFCEKWHPPECLFHKSKSGCRNKEKCSYAHRQVDEQPSKRSKKNDDKSAVAMLKKGWWARKRMATCFQPWQKSREIGDWIVSFKTWSRRSLSYGRAQPCRNQSNVWNSRKLLHVTLNSRPKSFARIYLPRWSSWA